ncbi:MAG: ABC transporter substrate binding protein [Desulfobulbales bacterium]|nr:ABC transporter substrate binding protein [Desulfobulbales bacterium]
MFLILSSQESEPYVQARKGFEKSLSQYFPDANFIYHHAVQGKESDAYKAISGSKARKPTAVFSLGTGSTEYAQTEYPDCPLVASMLLSDNVMQKKPKHSGILLQFPAEIQLLWVNKFLPQATRIGILYDPARNSEWVKEANKSAQEMGLEIIAFAADTAAKIQSGLKYISKNADVLLAIPDKIIYSGKTAKMVLLFTHRNRIPFVGLSAAWVKAGALYALEADYGGLGRQAAELIREYLDGNPSDSVMAYPEKATYTVNKKTSEHLHLEIDSELIKGAAKVFE